MIDLDDEPVPQFRPGFGELPADTQIIPLGIRNDSQIRMLAHEGSQHLNRHGGKLAKQALGEKVTALGICGKLRAVSQIRFITMGTDQDAIRCLPYINLAETPALFVQILQRVQAIGINHFIARLCLQGAAGMDDHLLRPKICPFFFDLRSCCESNRPDREKQKQSRRQNQEQKKQTESCSLFHRKSPSLS